MGDIFFTNFAGELELLRTTGEIVFFYGKHPGSSMILLSEHVVPLIYEGEFPNI